MKTTTIAFRKTNIVRVLLFHPFCYPTWSYILTFLHFNRQEQISNQENG